MRASEFTKPGTITLDQIYDGQMPDRDEHIWNYVSERDFNIPFTINTIQPRVLANILEIRYGVDDIEDLFHKMQPEQEEIVRDYQRDPNLSQEIIVLHKDHIIDGNHRALAAALAKKPIRYIDVSEGGENINEVKEDGIPAIGINVRSDGDRDYADLIVDGKKKLETRNTDSLRPYVGKRVAIVRTGRGKAQAIGSATVGEPIVADEQKFRKLQKHHLVPQGSAFDIRPDSTKYLYPMINPVRFPEPREVGHGIVGRKVFENTIMEDVVGPFKVIDYDGSQVTLDTGKTIKLSPKVKDKPRIGYNYAFDIENNTATKLVLLTVDNVVVADNEILMIKRKHEPYANHWALPGGFIDPGETPEQAARRELAEETGLVTGSALRYIGRFDTPNRDPRMRDAWSYAFLAKTRKTNVEAGDDASAAKWIPMDKLNLLPIAFDHKKIIGAALSSDKAN